jgi:HrpA-like RNA helicase
MSMPTLKIRGNLRAPDGDPDTQRALAEIVPIEYILDWFRTRSQRTGIKNRVLILKSETASGKSTLFPPELYNALVRGGTRGIICTQPRVITATENVNEILKHYSKILRLGETIGWSTKFNKLRPTKVGLLSATIGTLQQQLRVMTDAEIITKYKFILIDETHERDLQTDMTIYSLKNLLLRNKDNPDCPFVVLMSATFDPTGFLRYFGGLDVRENFIWCTGASNKIDEMWDWNKGRTVNNYPQAAAEVVERIVRENPDDSPSSADILIFLPGKGEFKETIKYLEPLNEKLAKDNLQMSILQLDSDAQRTDNLDFRRAIYIPIEQHTIEIKGEKYTSRRRCILTTNVAETGLTLDNLRYVIDGGYNRETEYNPMLGIRSLITKPAPKSRRWQRRGRAGRKKPGVFYPLYPHYIHEKMPAQQFPQILIEDISPIALDIVYEQIKTKLAAGMPPEFSIADIDMIDVPTSDALWDMLDKLYALGFISPAAPRFDREFQPTDAAPAYGITPLGIAARGISVSPESARMILAGYFWGCSVLDLITIAAYLTLEQRVVVSRETDKMAKIAFAEVYARGLPGKRTVAELHSIWSLIGDDFITGLIIFNAIKSVTVAGRLAGLSKWCRENNISYRACIDFLRVRDDIIDQMLTSGFDVFGSEDRSLAHSTDNLADVITRIKHCIYDGYRCNIMVRSGTAFTTLKSSRTLTVAAPKLNNPIDKSGPVILHDTYVYQDLSIKLNEKTGVYDVLPGRVSAMSGFVSIDQKFY